MKTLKLLFLCICLFLGMANGWTQDNILRGSCGDNLMYALNTSTGVLTIGGTGEMWDYYGDGYRPATPWWTSGVTAAVIENGVTSIGAYAFSGCALTSISIGNSVTSVGYGAFYGCSSLTSITIPNSVTSIEDWAFNGCSGLTFIAIPNSVTSIGNWAFNGCAGLTSVAIGNSVTSIGSNAFSGCSGLTSVIIPNSLTSIGSNDFSGCIGLTSVTIPNSVTSIGDWAFSGCTGLTSITIPNSVTSIGINAFSGCTGLTSVSIPNSVTNIEGGAFQNCSNLTSITIPNSVVSIGGDAFSGCSGLKNVVIEDGTETLDCDGAAFNSPIESLYIGRNISGAPFNNNVTLTSVTIGNSVTSIEGNAFQGCIGLTSITIPNSVTSIGEYAFLGCIGLTSVTIPNSVTSIAAYAFRDCSSLTSVTIGNSMTSIGYGAFSGCSGLTSVTIPNGVTSIGGYAFSGCSELTSVSIPNSVTSLDITFLDCTALTDVTVDWTTPLSISDYNQIFSNVNTSAATLHVPAGTKALYEAANVWKDFGSIVEEAPNRTLSVSPASQSFAASGEEQTFAITSSTDWTVSSDASWLTVSPASGSNDGTVTVTVAENTDTNQRTATITISGPGATTQTISITQDATPIIPALSISLTSLNFAASGEQQTFSITSNTDWTVSGDASWLTVSPASGSNDGTVTVTAAENTVTSQRTATITISGILSDVNGDGLFDAQDFTTIATISVTQDAAEEIPTVIPEETQPIGTNGKGTIALNLSIPSNATLTGSFEIQFPDGIVLDEDSTALVPELAGNFYLSFTQEENNTWLIEINSNTLKNSTAVEYQQIMSIAYIVSDSVPKGSYDVKIANLDFLLDNGTPIKEDLLTIPVSVEREATSIKNVSNTSFYAYFINNSLKIESSHSELITIYSTTGVRLYSKQKDAGTIEIPFFSNPGSVYIIKGSVSGTIKVVK